MRIADFDLYKDMLMKQSGLTLSADKCYLLDSRLTPVAKKWDFASLDTMSVALRGMPDPALVKDIVEAMTTNETSFFRDGKPFELFKEVVLPYIAKSRSTQRSLRIWCAASSSGQEPYSLAITALENQHLIPGWKIEIVATDISDDILEIARKAEYSQFEVQRGLPIQLLTKYFEQNNENWKLKEEVRNMVKFQNFNLLNDMATLGLFDIILCRNVLIYFNEETKKEILIKMAKRIPSDGFLFLGGAETVLGISEDFTPMSDCRGLYVLREGNYDMEALEKSAAG